MQIWTPEPDVGDGEFAVRLNPGEASRNPFAVIDLSEDGGTALVMQSAEECDRLIRAAEAAKQLLTAGEGEGK
jgi:hypothetical protein